MSSFIRPISELSTSSVLNAACASVAALIGVAGYLSACLLQSQLASANAAMNERIVMLQDSTDLRTASQTLHDQAAAARSRVELLHARLPKDPDETQFLQELSALADNSHLDLSEFRPGGVLDRGTHKEIDLRIRARGAYANLCRFLAELSQVPRFVRVSQLNLVAPSDHGGDCDFDLQLYLAFGFKPDPSHP
jgi:Tfp pilus assembly protein PilO